MLVLTQPFDIPPSFETNQYGIGLWTNIQQGQSYFYCASTLDDYHHPRSSAIFRININEQLSSGWEFVGKVDFPCRNNTISSCGRHFWSVDISPYPRIGLPYQLVPRQLILRKVDPKTLEYEVFQVSGRVFLLARGILLFDLPNCKLLFILSSKKAINERFFGKNTTQALRQPSF